MSTPTYTNLSSLVEQPDSRRRESGDTVVETRIYVAEYAVCAAAQKSKGTIGSGDLEGYEIRSSVVEPVRGLAAKLIDTWVAGGDDADPEVTPLPPDEVTVGATNQAPQMARNPLFRELDDLTIGNAFVMSIVDAAIRAPDADVRKTSIAQITGSALTTDQKNKALRLIKLTLGGAESFYFATLRYSWVTHSYIVPTTTRGGYVESISGPLASYFVPGITWLREADDLQKQGGVWRLTRSWLGGDAVAFPADIYPSS